MTSFTSTKKNADEVRSDAAALFMFKGEKVPGGIADKSLRADLGKLLAEEGFEGKPGQALVWHTNGRSAARRYVVVGLGKKEKFSPSVLRDAVATAARKAESWDPLESTCRHASLSIL